MAEVKKQWTPLELVKTTEIFFQKKGIPTPRLDAELLLAHVLGCTRIGLYTDFERLLTTEEVDRYRELVRRRSQREPVSRILGEKEFMGHPFLVTPAVLSPRPETEILVEEAVRLLGGDVRWGGRSFLATEKQTEQDSPTTKEAAAEESSEIPPRHILDLGTGSGCIAISLAIRLPKFRILASDLSSAALEVARENARRLGVEERIDFREGDLFSVCRAGEGFDAIVCNPPYLNLDDPEIWPEVRDFDPKIALDGGKDGLDFYRRIAVEVERWLNPGGWLLLELGAGQWEAVVTLFAEETLLDSPRALLDYQGKKRVLVTRRPLP